MADRIADQKIAEMRMQMGLDAETGMPIQDEEQELFEKLYEEGVIKMNDKEYLEYLRNLKDNVDEATENCGTGMSASDVIQLANLKFNINKEIHSLEREMNK